jgi:uncharacterized protein (TIGR04255 family)
MQVPISISPNPLFTSTVEIRFTTNINRFDLLQKMNSAFRDEFPIIEEGNIPHELKEHEEQFRYAADFILKNDDFSISFGTRSISFENVSDYKYWDKYFTFIKESLKKVFELKFIERIERCGVRYGSMLDGHLNPENMLIDLPKLQINQMNSKFRGFQSMFNTDNSNLYLQISTNLKIVKDGVTKTGLYIDIDASNTSHLKPNEDVFIIINNLHMDQKQLFFGLLKTEYLETLNPKYS